ncbi:MAG: sensor histidine kinase [Corynebacterium urealyticum]|uniref:Oxygen sensor histidine kinase NreB n=1 Tax=Corynebacterium urealyticum TaxID=43771 RepID=A0A2W5B2C2_9CORY|nr:MAG: sensor histidine kinase [Corynebacterium urealyticum]
MNEDPRTHPVSSQPATLDKLSHGLWLGLQVLMIGLLILVAWRATHPMTWVGLGVFWVIYCSQRLVTRWVGAPTWFALLVGAWAVMSIGQLEGAFVVFPMFFLAVYVFSPRISAVVVAALTLGVVTMLVGHIGWNIGAMTGPTIGAAVAWTLGVGFQLLHREATAKARALDALVAAREEALASSRKAGEADERMRLAGDIHDTVAQGLSSIHMLLTAVESQLEAASSARAGEAGVAEAGGAPDSGRKRAAAQHPAGQPEIEAVHQRMLTQVRLARSTASENLAETRRIIAALQPAPLEGAALPVALARLASSTPLGEKLSFETDGAPRPLPDEVEEGLLRCAQSLVSNVVRHAGADRAKLSLTFHPGDVILDVVDNGAGFDPSDAIDRGATGGSLGLSGVYRRVQALGGEMTIESAPGEGTGISITVPTTGYDRVDGAGSNTRREGEAQ